MARTRKRKQRKSSLPQQDDKAAAKHSEILEETIIAAVNFSKLGNSGFFVNWLATSNEDVHSYKYGDSTSFLCKGKMWQRRGLSLLLLRLANLSVLSHLRQTNAQFENGYNIVLQARASADEPAARFYHSINFDEGGPISSISELDNSVFHGFRTLLEAAEKSTTDYVHFIFDDHDIVVFVNSTGNICKKKTYSSRYAKEYPSATPLSKKTLPYVRFPFAARRDHLLLLSSGLEFFNLPFNADVQSNLDGFLEASTHVPSGDSVPIYEREVQVMSKDKSYLTDVCIDFLFRW
jgi:hypothetical protein